MELISISEKDRIKNFEFHKRKKLKLIICKDKDCFSD